VSVIWNILEADAEIFFCGKTCIYLPLKTSVNIIANPINSDIDWLSNYLDFFLKGSLCIHLNFLCFFPKLRVSLYVNLWKLCNLYVVNYPLSFKCTQISYIIWNYGNHITPHIQILRCLHMSKVRFTLTYHQ
jgi:hypothetical protein